MPVAATFFKNPPAGFFSLISGVLARLGAAIGPKANFRFVKKLTGHDHVVGKRLIDDILAFRTDISPFLVHLTKNNGNSSASQRLEKIIQEKKLIQSGFSVNFLKDIIKQEIEDINEIKKYISAICFSDTPLSEIHCLLDIQSRATDLQPYGLAFLKEKLIKKHVNPVFYFNKQDQSDEGIKKLIIQIIKIPDVAKTILPLISFFGYQPSSNKRVDFLWEREWRLPYEKGALDFDFEDIFIGLCPDEEIPYFENKFKDIKFIDPYRNIQYYADKLINRRKELELDFSVV